LDTSYDPDPAHRVSRIAERAAYDHATVHAILDAGYVCHIGFVAEGKPVVIPMSYWRDGEHVYFHSAVKGRFADACAQSEVCLTVTHFDGLVLGHSAFNHSFNYRSVVLHGRAEVVSDYAAKTAAMQSFVERTVPGRWPLLRPVRDSEIRAITLLRLKLDQVSAKVREGWPDEETVAPDWPVWVGVLPAATVFGAPLADPGRNRAEMPDHVARHSGRR
jgi:nitroimidazol reductase NimA-like FMN-containing flavoprotein (pyridoxamine 5'-phosphate oxidase superfamily)